MEKIYQISKSQIVIIIIFSVVLEFFVISNADHYNSSEIWGFLAILIPFLCAFYVIGWKNYDENKRKETELKPVDKKLKKE